MLSIAVCDDEVIECCNMAKRIKEIMEEMKIPCIIRQFRSGGELLQALESFDIVFLDIIMQDLQFFLHDMKADSQENTQYCKNRRCCYEKENDNFP